MYAVVGESRPGSVAEVVAGMEPGPELGRLLADMDPDRLSGHDRVVVLAGLYRMVAYYQARFYEMTVAVHDAVEGLVEADLVFDTAASEMRAALAWTRRAAEYHLDVGLSLFRLPCVLAALGEGRIDLAKARLIVEHTSLLDPGEAARVAETVLPHASGLTTGQLGAWVDRLCMELDPDTARERYQTRIRDRRVVVEATEAGTANLFAMDLPAVEANAVYRRIDRIAKKLKTGTETRTLDQIRADVLLDLLSGKEVGDNGSVGRGVVDIRVDLETLAGLADRAGEIPGYGPVIADVARQVAETREAEWRVAVTGPDGEIRHLVTTRRRPNAYQRRLIEALNPTCVGPGCRISARVCDLDHGQPWAQTRHTDTEDLGPLCRYDHTNKHLRGWKLRRLRPGVYQWTSPLGHTYTVGPDPP